MHSLRKVVGLTHQVKSGYVAFITSMRPRSVSTSILQRSYSASVRAVQSTDEPEKSVFISQSSDIHTNLALEDWIYQNFNFDKHEVLLLWRNAPSVVIGRHQNPWSEVDVSLADEWDLPVVRRNSGGGCVYHDTGNLNCTFFTTRKSYDRKYNLEIICKALRRRFGVDAEVSPRLDVNVEGYKISGTAAKLGKNAYHHCTVLVDADVKKLHNLLNPEIGTKIQSKATASVKAPVKNLKQHNSSANIPDVVESIGLEFLRTDRKGNDGGEKLIQKQRGFQMVNPTNEWFPGLGKIRSNFQSWEWNFGKTPEFTVHQSYPLGMTGSHINATNIDFHLKIVKGRIETAQIQLPYDKEDFLDGNTLSDLHAFINALRDRPFRMDILATFEGLLFRHGSQVSSVSNQIHRDMQESLLIA